MEYRGHYPPNQPPPNMEYHGSYPPNQPPPNMENRGSYPPNPPPPNMNNNRRKRSGPGMDANRSKRSRLNMDNRTPNRALTIAEMDNPCPSSPPQPDSPSQPPPWYMRYNEPRSKVYVRFETQVENLKAAEEVKRRPLEERFEVGGVFSEVPRMPEPILLYEIALRRWLKIYVFGTGYPFREPERTWFKTGVDTAMGWMNMHWFPSTTPKGLNEANLDALINGLQNNALRGGLVHSDLFRPLIVGFCAAYSQYTELAETYRDALIHDLFCYMIKAPHEELFYYYWG